ncbi:MBL fold metallo-hydrolase [Methanonatronarchaeum sp. AMET6-2]|uniref:MBL fold metallo-hydrolase n=1 Tax=Methanonatronarchaeum sp. AMET6-2 TaxID=2933293 RepID=UPI00121BDB45|nr:MBL fold metallo-hydrolase [Methanonatronarchaeum sp. AMET6-2]RZN60293.1 MAG: MBL fold metallo-hydrolase [Methanonatronarchaeia archaeon]UOY10537.1 MBL fold metallo-hydrolase [Methanonatronarchaeum sp. AMET6-2]
MSQHYEYIGPDKLKVCGEDADKNLDRIPTKMASELLSQVGSYSRVYWDESYGRAHVETDRTGSFQREKDWFFKETGWGLNVHSKARSEMVRKVRELIYEYEGRYEFLKTVSRNVNRTGDASWVRLSFLGGGREVGRNSILIQTPQSKVLLDCGVKMETSEGPLSAPELDIDTLDAIVVSHAHIDHTGEIATLVNRGYEGPVYATEPTLALMRLLKRDFYRLQREQTGKPGFNKSDIDRMLNHSIPTPYNEQKKIAPDIKLILYNAGHLPGSAGILLRVGNKNIYYTGDFSDRNDKLLPPANQDLPPLDVLITESTYSHESIPGQKKAESELINAVEETTKRGGIPVISTFAVGRSQEVLSLLADRGYEDIYVDGMITEATKIVGSYPEYIKPRLNGDYNWIYSDNQRQKAIRENAIIITTSGMLNGGPISYYLREIGDDDKNTLILPGYMVEGSQGRRLQEGEEKVVIDGEEIHVKMDVKQIRFSGHSDRSGIWSFLHNLNGEPKTFVIHGDKENCVRLTREIGEKLGWKAHAPHNLDAYRI